MCEGKNEAWIYLIWKSRQACASLEWCSSMYDYDTSEGSASVGKILAHQSAAYYNRPSYS
jgi:hypothetical protein